MSVSAAILERLKRLHPRSIDLSLGRVERLLARLDHPETRVPPVVHVAGTNGKGSVVAFLRAIFEAAGMRVHTFTSPHLVRFSERIVVSGQEIAEEDLVEVLETCETINSGDPITFFEITTAAAFLAFARTPADITLLETGLGGRLDATNVVTRPALTVLTSVSIDHQRFLGETLAEIAGEKAGILKPNVSCISAKQDGVAATVIRRRAAEVGSPLREEGRHWTWELSSDGLKIDDIVEGGSLKLPHPTLIGEHQGANAGVAVTAARNMPGHSVPLEALRSGLRNVCWPARLQRLDGGRLVSLLAPGCELWLDGGHNVAAAEVLAREISTWLGPVHLIIGMMAGKDTIGFLSCMCPYAATVTAISIPGETAAVRAEDLAAQSNGLGFQTTSADTVGDALMRLKSTVIASARVLICGSLYLAGHVLAENAR